MVVIIVQCRKILAKYLQTKSGTAHRGEESPYHGTRCTCYLSNMGTTHCPISNKYLADGTRPKNPMLSPVSFSSAMSDFFTSTRWSSRTSFVSVRGLCNSFDSYIYLYLVQAVNLELNLSGPASGMGLSTSLSSHLHRQIKSSGSWPTARRFVVRRFTSLNILKFLAGDRPHSVSQ